MPCAGNVVLCQSVRYGIAGYQEDFLVKILDVDAAGLSSWAFAKGGCNGYIDNSVYVRADVPVRSNIKVLCMLLGLVTCGTATLSFLAFNYSAFAIAAHDMAVPSKACRLYTVYLSFQTLFFERFIACFKIKGNVGFFIITLDFIGYTGTVVVLIFKEFFNPAVNWLDFLQSDVRLCGYSMQYSFYRFGSLSDTALSS